MNIGEVFDKVIGTLINEMARGDLKGAGKDLINKNWAKAAEIYVKNAKERGLDDSKIVSGLGATFRGKSGSDTVTVGKTEDDEEITLTKSDVTAMKKAVKEFMGYETKASKKSKEKSKKAEEQSDKDSKALKKAMGKGKKDDDEEVTMDLESKEEKKNALREEILKLSKY
jgi:hypothetical protein